MGGLSVMFRSPIWLNFSSPVVDRRLQTVFGEFSVDRTALEPPVPKVFGHGFQIPNLSVQPCARLVSQTVHRLVGHARARAQPS
jgi:hypothetical protein